MKKLLLASFVLATIGANAQTKKVILHDYTGVNCQYCTDGTLVIEGLISSNPTTFIPMQIHTGAYTPASSAFKTAEGDAYNTITAPSGYPAGSVDMVVYGSNTVLSMGRGSWSAAYSVQAAKTAYASVSIANRVDKGSGNYEADIIVKFTSVPTGNMPLNINFYILEDSIHADGAYQQSNWSGGPHGGASPLTWTAHQYVHNNVLRKTLGGAWGFTGIIPNTPVVGTTYTKHIAFTADATWITKNLRVIAAVQRNGTVTLTDKEYVNGEMMKLSSFFKTGVNNVPSKLNIVNVYPSLARVGDVINVEYNSTESGMVTMNVYNMAGQKVATPYSSDDVQGGHTMQFKTALYDITPGTYVLEVVSEAGRQTQKITIQ
jgi:hypothetical protein